MDAREVALALARGRILFGAGLALAPGSLAAVWIGRDAKRRAVTAIVAGGSAALGGGLARLLDPPPAADATAAPEAALTGHS